MATQYYGYYHPAAAGDYYDSYSNIFGGSDYYYWQSNYYNHSTQPQPLPLHLCFFLAVLFLFLGTSWYASYGSALEDFVDQLKVAVVLVPVLVLLAIHCLSEVDRRWMPFLLQFPEGSDSLHMASGGSPWGVAVVLVVLIFMMSYRPAFQEKWFPLFS